MDGLRYSHTHTLDRISQVKFSQFETNPQKPRKCHPSIMTRYTVYRLNLLAHMILEPMLPPPSAWSEVVVKFAAMLAVVDGSLNATTLCSTAELQ